MGDEVTTTDAGSVDTGTSDASQVVEATAATSVTDLATEATNAAVESTTEEAQIGSKSEDPELKRARDEAARYRTERNKYKSVFDNFEDEAQEAWLELMNAAVNDPSTAVERAQQLIEDLKSVHADVFDDNNRPLTVADLKAIEEEKLQEKAIEQVFEKVKSFNDPVTGAPLDPASPKGRYFMILADTNDADFEKAAQILESEKQAIIDAYVQDKVTSANGTPKAPAASGVAPGTESAPSDMKSARKAALSYLAERQPQV